MLKIPTVHLHRMAGEHMLRVAGRALVGVLACGTARAETLHDAVLGAYAHNPSLLAARAAYRAEAEQINIARAPGLPQLQITGSAFQPLARDPGFPTRMLERGVSLNLSQLLYGGGEVRHATRAARRRTDAAAFTLEQQESNLLVDTVRAYMEVLRARDAFDLNARQVSILTADLDMAETRRRYGDVTDTDVAQSRARLANAQALRSQAVRDMQVAENKYEALVGHMPGALAEPVVLPPPAPDPNDAVEQALKENPLLRAAQRQVAASQDDIGVARAGRLPRLSFFATTQYGDGTDGTDQIHRRRHVRASAGLTLTIPFYQGGLVAARVRQAEDTAQQRLEMRTEVERNVIATTRSAVAIANAADSELISSQASVVANEAATEGVRAELASGERTTLDLLNAQLELLQSQLASSRARRDRFTRRVELLDRMGEAVTFLVDAKTADKAAQEDRPIERDRQRVADAQTHKPTTKLDGVAEIAFDLAALHGSRSVKPNDETRLASSSPNRARTSLATTKLRQQPDSDTRTTTAQPQTVPAIDFDLTGLATAARSAVRTAATPSAEKHDPRDCSISYCLVGLA